MPPVTIRFGGYQPPASVHNRAADLLGAKLSARLGETVDFQLEGNIIERGRSAADLLTMVETGELTMCYFSSSYLADLVPEFALLDLPFVITERVQAYAALDGRLGRFLAQKLAEISGYRILAYWDNGFRHFSNRVHPIRAPADCAGLRIRTLSSALHTETFQRLGFDPVMLDVKDLIDAVKGGTIDAQDNPLTNIFNFDIHKFHRHITLSAHIFGTATVLVHKQSYDLWPDETRLAVDASVAEATAAQRAFAAAEDALIIDRLNQSGTKFITLTAEERLQFQNTVAPVIEKQRERFGAALFNLLG
jgi:TRAP-type transport system periplasmic protein